MSAPRHIPDGVRAKQVAASDPRVSAWVAANAGSGKTHVLAQRVIRLLLDRVEPASILCITFTKAAAANMANRVFDTLREWTAFDDTALDEAMKTIGVLTIDAEQRAQARRLFALALETPGGLKVQTIHAFCTHLLHAFPFEARVAARFTVLDEGTETQLLDTITLGVLIEAAAKPDTPLGYALVAAIAAAADLTFRDVLNDTIRERDALAAWIDHAGSVDGAIGQLATMLGIEPSDTVESVDVDFFKSPLVAPQEWPAIAAALAEGSKTDNDHARRFSALAKLSGTDRLDTYLDIFCTKERLPRKNIVTKAIETKHPVLTNQLKAEQDRVCALIERRRAVEVMERTRALVTIADEVLRRFDAEKDRRGLLDYDDLIDKALALLTNTSAAWVHYKLDRGINHVLIDEAQDTSPKQWAIVKALVAEFFAGEGAQSARRTIFAVGDEKQSIFSFQGAAPREFEIMRREFDTMSRAANRELHRVNLDYSFRSGANVLEAVDTVFKANSVHLSIVSESDGYLEHAALPDAAPGLVEIWDTEMPADRREIEGWDAPFDTVTETSPIVRLADRIARSVKAWQRQGTRTGDVLILVRRRGTLFEAIIRALKNLQIAVAGADRLVLTEHIAVMDMIALADALLLPDDDLALATVLKSPLFGFDDEQLYGLAWKRERSLRTTLQEKAAGEPLFAQAAAQLDQLAQWAADETPFAFYARLLNSFGGGSGRGRILARLGPEASDALDEFLNLALDYESSETPTLRSFVAWLRAAKSEVKRDMDIARDEVRVMTVHGAKGLEAKTVILADTTTPPEGFHPPRILALPAGKTAPGAPDRLVWAFAKSLDVGPMTAAREQTRGQASDEYRRLLYVAMTRAIDRLVICGADGSRSRPEGCWYDLVSEALKDHTVEEAADDGDATVRRYRKYPVEQTEPDAEHPARAPAALPEWIRRDAPAETATPKRVRPSPALEPAEGERSGRDDARQRALQRGNLVHRLLQSLPDVVPGQRADKTQQFLARNGKDFSEAERAAMARQVFAVLDDPRFAALFAPDSRAELSIAGRIESGTVMGQVDRLAITPEAILIADYKTNRPAPRTLAEAAAKHAAYIKQLALYRRVLMRLYPDRPVRAALVWTETPQLMEIPAERLDSALVADQA